MFLHFRPFDVILSPQNALLGRFDQFFRFLPIWPWDSVQLGGLRMKMLLLFQNVLKFWNSICPEIFPIIKYSWNLATFCPEKVKKVLENVLECPEI